MRGALTLAGLALVWFSAGAEAQTSASTRWEPPPGAEPAPPEPALSRYLENAWLVSQFQLGVPLLLDVERDEVRPGANLGARFSIASRYLGGGMHGSFQWIPVEAGRGVDPLVQASERMPLRRASFGPFLSAELPNPSAVVPQLQIGFDFNFWNYDESSLVCDFWQCTSSNVYHFTPGVHARIATKVALATRRRVFLDLGLETGVSFPGNFFAKTEAWVTPYLGMGVAN